MSEFNQRNLISNPDVGFFVVRIKSGPSIVLSGTFYCCSKVR